MRSDEPGSFPRSSDAVGGLGRYGLPPVAACAFCAGPMPPPAGTGRPAVFCSGACHKAAHETRRTARPGAFEVKVVDRVAVDSHDLPGCVKAVIASMQHDPKSRRTYTAALALVDALTAPPAGSHHPELGAGCDDRAHDHGDPHGLAAALGPGLPSRCSRRPGRGVRRYTGVGGHGLHDPEHRRGIDLRGPGHRRGFSGCRRRSATRERPAQRQIVVGTGVAANTAAPSSSVVDDVLTETAGATQNLTSSYTLSADEALTAGQRWVGEGYVELGKPGSGVFRSADGLQQFRMDGNSLMGTMRLASRTCTWRRTRPGRRCHPSITTSPSGSDDARAQGWCARAHRCG